MTTKAELIDKIMKEYISKMNGNIIGSILVYEKRKTLQDNITEGEYCYNKECKKQKDTYCDCCGKLNFID